MKIFLFAFIASLLFVSAASARIKCFQANGTNTVYCHDQDDPSSRSMFSTRKPGAMMDMAPPIRNPYRPQAPLAPGAPSAPRFQP